MRTWIVILGLALLVGCARTKTYKRAPLPPPPPPPSPIMQRQALAEPEKRGQDDRTTLLVRRRGPVNDVAAFHKKHGVRVKAFKHTKWQAVEVGGHDADALYRVYKKSQLFDAMQWSKIYSVEVIPNDDLYSKQWDLAKIEAPLAWDVATTNDVVVAVIDTGIDFTHPDLRDNLWSGPEGEQGYTSLNGFLQKGGADNQGHGTHVAGTIAAVGNNAEGITGINWGGTKLLSLKFITSAGTGKSYDAGICIEKMIELRESGVNIRVSNNSWGGGGADPFLEDMFEAAGQAGILNVCGAGNNGMDTDDTSFIPATLPVDSIISAMASDQNDAIAYFSNFGLATADLLAPGVSILSCRWGGGGGGYWSLSGTSMASPHVAGAAAMLFGLNRKMTVAQAKSLLLHPDNFDRTPFTHSTTAGGRLNLRKLWSNPTLQNPTVNHEPTVALNTPTNWFILPSGTTNITLTANFNDADGDNLFYTTKAYYTSFQYHYLSELFYGGSHKFYLTNDNTYTFSLPPLALDQRLDAQFAGCDGHGGAALAKQIVWAYRDESQVRDLNASVVGFRAWLDATNRLFYRLDMNTADKVTYAIQVHPPIYGHTQEECCREPNQDIGSGLTLPRGGTYTVRPCLMDSRGNFTTGPRSIVVVSNISAAPPEIKVNFSTKRGPAPLEVVADMSGSVRNGATNMWFAVRNWGERATAFPIDSRQPIWSLTLSDPGVYAFEFAVAGNFPTAELEDGIVELITVLPASSEPIPQPLQLAMLSTPLRIQITSEPKAVVRLDGSADLRVWSAVTTVTNTSGTIDVPLTASGERRFYRASQ